MNSVDSTENKAHPSPPIPGVSFILLKQTNCALVWINMKMGHCHNHFCIFYTFISLCKKKGSSVSLSIIRKAQKIIILSTTNFFSCKEEWPIIWHVLSQYSLRKLSQPRSGVPTSRILMMCVMTIFLETLISHHF